MKPAREPASSRPKPCAFLKKPHESCPFAAPCGPRRKKNDRGQRSAFPSETSRFKPVILAHRGSALPWLVNDRAALRLRRIWCVKLQTLFLYLFGVYCMFHQYSNHIQSENQKTENRKNQRYSGYTRLIPSLLKLLTIHALYSTVWAPAVKSTRRQANCGERESFESLGGSWTLITGATIGIPAVGTSRTSLLFCFACK